MSTTWDSLFSEIENDIGKSLNNVSKQIIYIWQELLEDKFYSKYNPKLYERSWQTLDSIRKLDLKKTKDGYELNIGYDINLIQTETVYSYPYTYIRHEDPSIQPSLVEDGWTMQNGEFRQGAHAFEDMLKYVQSSDFKALFGAEMKKLGYIFKY